MQRVTGIGGIFFKSRDSAKLRAWYAQHLGIDTGPEGGISFEWREKDRPERVGFTVWSIFPHNTPYFDPSGSPFMINYRVADLDEFIAQLKRDGVEIDGGIEKH